MAAITSIYLYLVLTYISVLDFAIKECGYLFWILGINEWIIVLFRL
jgi:hypothetical protein